MTITQPTTVYAQVELIDPFGDGSCSQGDFGADCDSQVIALTIQPICAQVLVKAAYTTKQLVKRGHWLRKNGHFAQAGHGHRRLGEADVQARQSPGRLPVSVPLRRTRNDNRAAPHRRSVAVGL